MARPRSFDREQGLEKAMRLFWQKGYAETSIGDLSAAIGINRPSLYAAYGDKEALFLEALSLYHRTITEGDRRAIADATSATDLARRLLANCAARVGEPGTPDGCMMSGAIADLGSMPPEMAQRITVWITDFEALIAARLRDFAAGGNGDSRDNGGADQRAALSASILVMQVIGFGVYGRIGQGRAHLQDMASTLAG